MTANNSTIAFLSSDARKLYRDDILRVTSYPNGFVIKFRYKQKYINTQIVSQINNLSNREAIIFFTVGNSLHIPKEERTLVNVPVRKAVIKKVIHQQNTQNYEFYLELGEFLQSNNSQIEFPKNEFVAYTNHQLSEAPWKIVIDNIKNSFKDSLFYIFNISEKSDALLPIFDEKENVSYFKLQDENSYYISISFYDVLNENSSEKEQIKQNVFTLKEPSDRVIINIPDDLTLDTVIDDRTYNAFTKSLDNNNTNTFLNFIITQGKNNDSEILFNDYVRIQIKKDTNKIWVFTLNSFLLALSIFLTTVGSKAFDLYGSFDIKLVATLLLAIILFWISAYNLFKFFNKK